MPATGGTNVAALGQQLQTGLAQLQGMGLNLGNITGGGGTGAATQPGATATQPGATGTTAGANGQALPAGPVGTFPTNSGRQVLVSRDNNGSLFIQPTGAYEVANVQGKTVRFDAKTGKAIRAFELTDGLQFKIPLDYRDGIATGLANLSRIFGARQERVKLLSNALADDANETGSFNPVDLQKMSLETTTTQQLSEMQKKIFDSMRDSIQAWLR